MKLKIKKTGLFLITLLLNIPFSIANVSTINPCSSIQGIPFNWETENTLEGADSVVVKLFFIGKGIDVEFLTLGSWARCLKSVEFGTIDIAIAAYKAPERTKYGIFVEEIIGVDYL